MDKTNITLKLFEIEAIKFGDFTLKSGLTSPIYIDLRMIISYPTLLKSIAEDFCSIAKDLEFDVICGVPYTALPIATAMAIDNNFPMIMRRKETKDYGLKKAIEGKYKKGDRCLIIEDLVTSGKSVLETIKPIEEEGIIVKDIIVLIDREQGGKDNLTKQRYQLHSILSIYEIIETLTKSGKITNETAENVKTYIGEKNALFKAS